MRRFVKLRNNFQNSQQFCYHLKQKQLQQHRLFHFHNSQVSFNLDEGERKKASVANKNDIQRIPSPPISNSASHFISNESPLPDTLEEIEKSSKFAASLLKPPTFQERLNKVGASVVEFSLKIGKKIPIILWKITKFIMLKIWEFIWKPSVVKEWWRDLKVSVKEALHHYWIGTKLLWADTKTSLSLLGKMMKGEELTRRERKQLLASYSDMLRMVPLAAFVIVPFLEFTLPFALKIFPNLLPRQFEDASQKSAKEDAMKKRLAVQLNLAKFLQDTVSVMAADLKEHAPSAATVAKAVELKQFIERIRDGEPVNADEFLRFAKLFSDEITLDNITRPQLVAMCRYMGLSEYGGDALLRYRLNSKIRKIKADDRLIAWEGVKSLTTEELVTACAERGMNVGLSKAELQKQLENWLTLSLNKEISTSLLLLSRAFMFTQRSVPLSEDAIKDTLVSLPDEVLEEASASKAGSMTKMERNLQKLKRLKRQEQLIEEEKEELEELMEEVEEEANKEKASNIALQHQNSGDTVANVTAAVAAASTTGAGASQAIQTNMDDLKTAHAQSTSQPSSHTNVGLGNIVGEIIGRHVAAAAAKVAENGAALATLAATQEQDNMDSPQHQEEIVKNAAERIAEASLGSLGREKHELEEVISDQISRLSSMDPKQDKQLHRLLTQVNSILHKIERKIHLEQSANIMETVLDKNKDGFISTEEIQEYLKSPSSGKVYSQKQIDVIVNSLDKDKDGRVSIKQLLQDLEKNEDEKSAV